jgi:hypothetical protein
MKWRALVTSFGLALTGASGALAAGGPVPPVQGGHGIGVPGSPVRFIASRAGRDTVIRRVATNAWHVQAALRVPGRYGIPGADYNGTLTGLSADGRTLILEQFPSAYPPRTTRLLVLDTLRMRIERRIVLPGWSVVDASSPRGRWMYLLHYSNIIHYEVLAYDLPHGRLIAKAIVDPRDRGEKMTGFPLARVMSPDGRWAYTLYTRPSGVPFVHALDTSGRRAVCIDLPSLHGLGFNTATFVLGPGANTLLVKIEGVIQASISTRTFAVSTGAPHRVSAPRKSHTATASLSGRGGGGGGGGGALPWEFVLLPVAGAAALGAAVWRRAKLRAAWSRRPASTT